jgi:hypothetical protein
MRTDFISSWEGDTELIEDITNLWSFVGAANNQNTPSWVNTGSYYAVISGSNIQSAVNALNTGLGDRTYLEHNYVSSGETLSDSLDSLDIKLKDLFDAVNASTGSRYIETPSSDIVAGTTHTLPYSLTYTPESTSGQEGKNMDVFVNGQLLNASTGTDGDEEDRDYSEVSGTQIKFHIDVNAYSNIMYVVRQ